MRKRICVNTLRGLRAARARCNELKKNRKFNSISHIKEDNNRQHYYYYYYISLHMA